MRKMEEYIKGIDNFQNFFWGEGGFSGDESERGIPFCSFLCFFLPKNLRQA